MNVCDREGCKRLAARQGPPFLAGAAVGVVSAYALDRELGRRRWHGLQATAEATARRSKRRLEWEARVGLKRTIGQGKGALHRLRVALAAEPLDDVTLAHKVESVLFRDPHVPKGLISVNAERGTVFLRGELESEELISRVAEAARKIRGVPAVTSLLHVPGTAAPHAGVPAG